MLTISEKYHHFCRRFMLHWEKHHFYYACTNTNQTNLNMLDLLFHALDRYEVYLQTGISFPGYHFKEPERTHLKMCCEFAVRLLHYCVKFDVEKVYPNYLQKFNRFARKIIAIDKWDEENDETSQYKQFRSKIMQTSNTKLIDTYISRSDTSEYDGHNIFAMLWILLDYKSYHTNPIDYNAARLWNQQRYIDYCKYIEHFDCHSPNCNRRKYLIVFVGDDETLLTQLFMHMELGYKHVYRVRKDSMFRCIKTKFFKCHRCKIARYCSRKCQKTHWNQFSHRYNCMPRT